MRTKRTATLAALSVGALFLGACGTAGGNSDSDGGTGSEDLAPSISVAISQSPDAYNGNTANANSVYNTYVDNLVHSNFASMNSDAELEHNTDFGTFEKTSDDPLTVKYTINEDAVWSDGTPIDFDDVLLQWAAMSGKHPGPEKDAETGVAADIFQQASTNGYSLVKMPEGEAGDKEFEFVYETPYADWEALMTGTLMPAHVAAEQGGLSTDNNGEALINAIKDNDLAALTPVAEFWNTGWNYQENLPSLPDAALLPSSGPYKLETASSGTLTLVKNDKYWGEERVGKTDSIVFKTIADTEAVQALQNGDVDVIDPSGPTVDTKTAIEQIGDNVKLLTGQQLTFTHIDLDQSETGVFKDLKVRQAFAKCVPREDIVDKFVKPVDSEASVLNLHEYQPSQPDYEDVLAGAPAASENDQVDIAGAKALLAEAGKTEPVQVRLMYSATSQLRADITALVKASCDQAGFDIVGTPDPKWSAKLSEPGSWDAIMFGWAGSGLAASGQSIYVSDGEQNFGFFSNPEVDSVWDDIATSTDADKVKELKKDLEQLLAEDVYNVVLFASPGLAAHNSKLSGLAFNPTQTGITWNAYEWTKKN